MTLMTPRRLALRASSVLRKTTTTIIKPTNGSAKPSAKRCAGSEIASGATSEHKYTAPVPEDVLFSRNEDCLTLGRYGVFVPVGSVLGILVADLLEVAKRGASFSND